MKLILLIGHSGSGKDFILRKALESINGLKCVCSHTTRPKRNTEIEGREYYFITSDKMNEMINNDEFIETRNYKTEFGSWKYGLAKSEIDINSNNSYIAIVDLNGLKEIEKYFEKLGMKDCITSLYIDVPSQVRLQRSLIREGNMTDEQVREVIRRFQNDEMLISPAKGHCSYIVTNESLKDAEEIVDFIKHYITGVC